MELVELRVVLNDESNTPTSDSDFEIFEYAVEISVLCLLFDVFFDAQANWDDVRVPGPRAVLERRALFGEFQLQGV